MSSKQLRMLKIIYINTLEEYGQIDQLDLPLHSFSSHSGMPAIEIEDYICSLLLINYYFSGAAGLLERDSRGD